MRIFFLVPVVELVENDQTDPDPTKCNISNDVITFLKTEDDDTWQERKDLLKETMTGLDAMTQDDDE